MRQHCFISTIGLMAMCSLSGTVYGATINYTEDTSNFCNPDRGLFTQQGALNAASLLNNRNTKGMTLEMVYYRLDDWKSVDMLPQTFLDKVKLDAAEARKAGCRMIPRFIYTWGCTTPPDAPVLRIQSHIDQLTPVLRANSDCIAHIQAGFIGLWGEWHHAGCTDPYGLDNTDSRKKVLFKLLDAVPNRCVVIRYPYMIMEIFGSTPLGPDSAFSGSYKARTGSVNDCFRASATDVGTYHNNSVEPEKQFASLQNRYVPQSGETCSGCTAYTGCDSVIRDFQRMHWDGMKNQVDACLSSAWQSGNCWGTIQKKMGYRLKLTRATLQDSVRPGFAFKGQISLVNVGWGKIYNYHGCELVFRNNATKARFKVVLSNDPRTWTKTDTASNVSLSALIPQTAADGAYAVYLNLPDTAQSIAPRPEYSIRLANNGVWEDSTGFNSLQHTVILSHTASPVRSSFNASAIAKSNDFLLVRRGDAVECSIRAEGASTVTFELFTISGALAMRRIACEKGPGRFAACFNTSELSSKVYLLGTNINNGRNGRFLFFFP